MTLITPDECLTRLGRLLDLEWTVIVHMSSFVVRCLRKAHISVDPAAPLRFTIHVAHGELLFLDLRHFTLRCLEEPVDDGRTRYQFVFTSVRQPGDSVMLSNDQEIVIDVPA